MKKSVKIVGTTLILGAVAWALNMAGYDTAVTVSIIFIIETILYDLSKKKSK